MCETSAQISLNAGNSDIDHEQVEFSFDAHPSERRNLLWLLFTNPLLHKRFIGREKQAPQMLSSFRRERGIRRF
ncbi:hypothetical protein [Pectobacterium brasiliense]|uniref:MmyB family transcriptional regulator n=1 Tax=Pectobacterium brasiliense TaxID=180957 RepID=UPI003D316ABA